MTLLRAEPPVTHIHYHGGHSLESSESQLSNCPGLIGSWAGLWGLLLLLLLMDVEGLSLLRAPLFPRQVTVD